MIASPLDMSTGWTSPEYSGGGVVNIGGGWNDPELYNPITYYNPTLDPAVNGGVGASIIPIPIRAAEGAKNMPKTIAPVTPAAAFDPIAFAKANPLIVGAVALVVFLMLKGK